MSVRELCVPLPHPRLNRVSKYKKSTHHYLMMDDKRTIKISKINVHTDIDTLQITDAHKRGFRGHSQPVIAVPLLKWLLRCSREC